jgi:hypothetical protein
MGVLKTYLDKQCEFVVFFWDHMSYSAGVSIRCKVQDFHALMRSMIGDRESLMGISITSLGAKLVHSGVEAGLSVHIVNAPLGVSVGATFNRIFTPEAVAQRGMDVKSVLLIDINADEILQYGGPCLGYDAEWNDHQPRSLPLQALSMAVNQWHSHLATERKKQEKRDAKEAKTA